MTLPAKLFVILAAAALVGCVHRPVFEYDVEPGAPASRLATIALNPQEVVWEVEGQQVVDPWEYREAVMKELKARGYQLTKADTADMWLDIIVTTPNSGKAGPRTAMRGPAERNMRAGGGSRQDQGGGTFGAPGGPVGPERAAFEAGTTEKTVIVRLTPRGDQKTLWYGSALMPPHKNGTSGPKAPAEWIHKLLEPLPPRVDPGQAPPKE